MKEEACVSLMESLDILRYERRTLANQYKKKGRQNIFMKLRVHTRLCVLCVKVGGGGCHIIKV